MRIGRDRRELQIAEAVLEVHVGEHEVVGELLLELGELAPVAERAGGRVVVKGWRGCCHSSLRFQPFMPTRW